MSETALKAGCKINLQLRITGRRPDGYHTLDSFFLPLPEPCDSLRITEPASSGPDGVFTVKCQESGIDPRDNTLTKAWRYFSAALAERKIINSALPPLEVELIKGIPHGSGLGGGSSDAAALLKNLNSRLGEAALTQEELAAVALKVGADVPFFLRNKPARVYGIGEDVHPAPHPFPGLGLLLICPKIRVNTAQAYADWDKMQAGAKASENAPGNIALNLTTGVARATKLPSCFERAENEGGNSLDGFELFNSFEAVVFRQHPELSALKHSLLEAGALGALMSGSGSSVFGLFRDPEGALAASRACRVRDCSDKACAGSSFVLAL